MSSALEAATAGPQLKATLDAGVDSLSGLESVVFTRYVRTVLPLDGFVFWIKADLLSDSALANAGVANAAQPNQEPSVATPAATLGVKGSFHKSTNVEQNEDETFGRQQVIFTAESPVNDLIAVGPEEIWIAVYNGARFAFSQRSPYYYQADLHHYVGDAVYPDMATQVVDDVTGFDAFSPVVSNSLPIWLGLNQAYQYPFYPPREVFPLYPSFAVPANVEPPWGAVHVDPDETEVLAAAPSIGQTSSHEQLARDVVRVTLYGLRNAAAIDFVDAVNNFTFNNPGLMGLMNSPVVRDEKRTQRELNTLSMKKTVVFEVSYLQQRVNDFALQHIKKVVPSYLPIS